MTKKYESFGLVTLGAFNRFRLSELAKERDIKFAKSSTTHDLIRKIMEWQINNKALLLNPEVISNYEPNVSKDEPVIEEQADVTGRESEPVKAKADVVKEKKSAEPKPADPEPEVKAPPVMDLPLPKNDRVWFKVTDGSTDNEKHDVFASINGDNVLIKRNRWVKLPRKFLAVFDDAVESSFELGAGEELVERKKPRFNYQVREIEDGVSPEKSRSL